jgi:hypothetical protein
MSIRDQQRVSRLRSRHSEQELVRIMAGGWATQGLGRRLGFADPGAWVSFKNGLNTLPLPLAGLGLTAADGPSFSPLPAMPKLLGGP